MPRRADGFQLATVWTSSNQPADWPHPLIAHKTRISFNEEAKANNKLLIAAMNNAPVISRRAPYRSPSVPLTIWPAA